MSRITKFLIPMLALGLFLPWGGCKKRIAETQSAVEKVKIEIQNGAVQASGCENSLNDVLFVSPATLPVGASCPSGEVGRVGFAVGSSNVILKTEDAGVTWKRVIAPTVEEHLPEFTSICLLNASEGYVVSLGRLLHTADAGQTWAPATDLPPMFYYFGPSSATGAQYYQMQPPTCGAKIYRAVNGGQSWTPFPVNLPRNDYGAVFFLNDTLGWVAGRYGICARTKNGGASWRKIDIKDNASIEQIQFVNPSDGWMRAEYRDGLFATRDGGKTWTFQQLNVEPAGSVVDMQFLDGKTGLALVRVEEDDSRICRTLDGVLWKYVAQVKAPLTAISFVSPIEGWAVGSRGLIVHFQLPD